MLQAGRRDATIRCALRLDAARKLHYNANLANVKFLSRQRAHDARRELPELVGGGPVRRCQREDTLVLADHLHLLRQLRGEGRREGLLHRNKSPHLHAYC
jgi:hypothetical protein